MGCDPPSLSFHSISSRRLRSTLFPYTTLFRSPCRSHAQSRIAPRMTEGVGASYFWGKKNMKLQLPPRSEEHTSELQSRPHLVCRLLLEKKNQHQQSGREDAVRLRESNR